MINNYLQIIMNNKIQKGQNPRTTSEAPGAKAGYCAWALHTAPPKGSADLLSHPIPPSRSADPSPLSPIIGARLPSRGANRVPVTCFHSLVLQESQWSLAWVPHLASHQFLLKFLLVRVQGPKLVSTKRFCRLTEDLGADSLTFTHSLIHTLTRWIFECLLTLLRCTVMEPEVLRGNWSGLISFWSWHMLSISPIGRLPCHSMRMTMPTSRNRWEY